ncbi:MAG: neuraminidase-like domain-containing protein, partial [Mucilaginibacter sp.]
MLQQLGIAAVDALAWTKDSLLAADTAKIKQVLKQRYNNSDWLQVSKPLQDTLREKKRDALIAYLLANPGTQTWHDTNDLYNYFLLDVEMCSCQPTSRIVQATNTVQLFVQRCFLSLENAIIIDSAVDSDWLQWQWMKNFRVWQANVKVFLYPENYIEPELLPGVIKSPFLAELENDLLQGEVTATNAEDAFQAYLEKLSNVARLEIKGSYYDDLSKTLHVFGRTFGGDPKVYYYRKFIKGRRWTPWIKVDLDINSEFIIPVVYNNRVYLFWAIITELANPIQQVNVPQAGQQAFDLKPPSKNWQIQLAYSEYKNGKWTPKKISENNDLGTIICEQATYPDVTRFFFAPFDLPIVDPGIYDSTGRIIGDPLTYAPKIKKAILKNGTLIISAHYYGDPVIIDHTPVEYNKYVGSFRVDIANGYPVKINFRTDLNLDSIQNALGHTRRNLVNVYDVELTDPATIPLPGINIALPDQARGRFKVLSSMQMGIDDRSNFFVYLGLLLQGGVLPADRLITITSNPLLPSFYHDQHRTYYLRHEYSDNLNNEITYDDYISKFLNLLDTKGFIFSFPAAPAGTNNLYKRFFNFFHPLVDYFMQRLFITGVDGLMDRGTQLKGDAVFDMATDKFDFASYYSDIIAGNKIVIYRGPSDSGLPTDDVDFSMQSGYGLYNWELFFHAPLMVAERLSQNQQFDDADRWYKYIFNPMDTSSYSSPNKFWNTKPFFETTSQDYIKERIDNVLKGINGGATDLLQDVTDWRNNPFQPHFIAEYRTVAYQKVAVMKYVSHLIRHGDYLFGQHTMESVNEATQLYILAAEILGPKPEVIPSVAKAAVDNYYQLEQKLDAMSDALVNVENLLPLNSIKGYTGTPPTGSGLPALQSLYFCTPMNERMAGPTGYWDTVADRLFKIRHCMNID